MENVMWARITVVMLRCTPSWAKSTKAETPATISGVTSGIRRRIPSQLPVRPRVRTTPRASAVPITVATTVVMAAILIDVISDSRSSSSFQNASYQRNESPSSTCSDLIPLNEKRITTTIGANRNA
jgi:hypothetical protein